MTRYWGCIFYSIYIFVLANFDSAASQHLNGNDAVKLHKQIVSHNTLIAIYWYHHSFIPVARKTKNINVCPPPPPNALAVEWGNLEQKTLEG